VTITTPGGTTVDTKKLEDRPRRPRTMLEAGEQIQKQVRASRTARRKGTDAEAGGLRRAVDGHDRIPGRWRIQRRRPSPLLDPGRMPTTSQFVRHGRQDKPRKLATRV
jgi:hypothetical protein